MKRRRVCLAHATCSLGKRASIRRKDKRFWEGGGLQKSMQPRVSASSINARGHLSSTVWFQLDHKCSLRSHVHYKVVIYMR